MYKRTRVGYNKYFCIDLLIDEEIKRVSKSAGEDWFDLAVILIFICLCS